MSISNKQLQRLKKSQAIAKSHCERNGTKLAHPIDFNRLKKIFKSKYNRLLEMD